MKMRSGFVSNSSSASFIVKFKSSLPESEISSIIRKSDEYLDSRWDETKRKVYRWGRLGGTVTDEEQEWEDCQPLKKDFFDQTEDGWEIHPSTSMFNDWMDISGWVFIRGVSEGRIPGLTLDRIIQTESEYDSCNYDVEFDPHGWDYNSIDDDRDDAEVYRKDALEKEERIKYDYLSYLSKINSPMAEEEIIYLTKNHLSKL